MTWEQVDLRRPDGVRTGPHTLAEVLAWNEAGQLPPDTIMIDGSTGDECRLEDYARLPAAPEGIPELARGGNAMNYAGLSVLLGVMSIVTSFFCCVFAVPFAVGSLTLGVLGLREASNMHDPPAEKMAIAGIILGALGLVLHVALRLVGGYLGLI
ncbi:hypothetical protein GC173_08740 [bacterium]|nr:hypothetical protein [bacterium]